MSDELEWSESYYFNFHDIKNDLTAFMRIGNKVNKDEKNMFFFVMKDGLTAGTMHSRKIDVDKLFCHGLRFIKDDGQKWKLTYSGPLFETICESPASHYIVMDIEWKALNDLVDYRDCVDTRGEELSSKVASEHYEQFGIVKGKLKIDEVEYTINALGERDRSEGVRDWGSPKMWMWLNSEFSTNDAFNMTRLSTENGDVDAGYFCRNGKNNIVNKANIDVSFDDRGIPTDYKMDMIDVDGVTYPMKGRIIRYAMLPFEGSKPMLLIESIAETEWKKKKGYGIAEFLVPRP